jgi:GNAT superfamily N-acetyltransferase
MDALPGVYAPPLGAMMLAFAASKPVGCVALRPLDDSSLPPNSVCEMKRMYLMPGHRGRGIGHALAAAIVTEARRLRYRIMRLDTDTQMPAAIAVYTRLGFQPRGPYNADPSPCTLWFELDLTR